MRSEIVCWFTARHGLLERQNAGSLTVLIPHLQTGQVLCHREIPEILGAGGQGVRRKWSLRCGKARAGLRFSKPAMRPRRRASILRLLNIQALMGVEEEQRTELGTHAWVGDSVCPGPGWSVALVWESIVIVPAVMVIVLSFVTVVAGNAERTSSENHIVAL